MVNFFRKIRRKLALDNKPLRYLRYAIGEIVLIVIGILIALQINNLNEQRKLNRLENDLLSEVKNGLEYDLKELKNSIEFHRSCLKSQDIIVDWIEGKINYNDTLGIHFLHTVFNKNFRSKEAPYETLKQVGLKIIKNDSLRNQISNLYDLEYEDMYWWQEDYDKIKSQFRNSYADLGFEVTGIKESNGGKLTPLDTIKLKDDKAYNFNLKSARGILDVFTNIIMTNVELELEKTIEMVESELQNN